MGHVNVVSGHIREAYYFGGDRSRRRLLLESNRRVIRDLGTDDSWPPMPAAMFAFTGAGEGSPTTPQYRGRVIHFGASYNQLLADFNLWRAKFENLLRALYWDDAMAMVQTEWWNDYVFQWRRAEGVAEGFLRTPPEPVSDWTLMGWRLRGPEAPVALGPEEIDGFQWD